MQEPRICPRWIPEDLWASKADFLWYVWSIHLITVKCIYIDYTNIDVAFLSFRWGHREPEGDVQACVQQEDNTRLLMYFLQR